MRKLKQEKNELNKISKISLETKYCNKIFITIFLISIIIIVMQKSTFAATLKFTDGVHDGEKTIKIGDNWKSNGTLTPTNGSGTIKINGLTVPYYIQHA